LNPPKPLPYRREPKRFPERKVLTIGIGVLCSTYPAEEDVAGKSSRPDALIMLADTMLSSETDSTQGHKIFTSPQRGVFAVGAGRMEIAGEIFSLVSEQISLMSVARMSGSVYKTISSFVNIHRQEKFKFEVVDPNFFQTAQGLHESMYGQVQQAWREYQIGVEMLFGVFNDNGSVVIYEIYGQHSGGFVEIKVFPGHWSVGTGAYNASMWLNYRKQHLGMSIEKSALHAFEAGRFAGGAPTVNSDIEVLIATKDSHFHMGKKRVIGSPGVPPITLSELENMADKYGPRSTDDLGFKSLNHQKSEDRP
jgi:hypothetical protein